jgi:endo-1,4-beta-xylanase
MGLNDLAAARGLKWGAAWHRPYHLADPLYSPVYVEHVGQITPENDAKMEVTQPTQATWDFAGMDATVAFAAANGMLVEGTPLIWAAQLPTWFFDYDLDGLQVPVEDVGPILQNRIETLVSRYDYVGSPVYGWVVLNEAFDDQGAVKPFWYADIYPGEPLRSLEQYFIWARAASPTAKLFYNDFSTDLVNAKSTAIYNWIADARSRGVPIDGIGFQSHYFQLGEIYPLWNVNSFRANLARFAALGLEIEITELDVGLGSPSATQTIRDRQYAIYRDIATVATEIPAVKSISTWGLIDKYSWQPLTGLGYEPLLFDDNYQPKANTYGAVVAGLTVPPPLLVDASPASFALTALPAAVSLTLADRFKFPGPLKIWNGTTFADASFKVFDGSTVS